MDDAKQQLIDRLNSANNILVTVSHDPSIDQLASCIGLTLLLNKQGKHAAAVFSGKVPSTLEFLQPDETLEKNTDSLRDFIISLDKGKADKLRYKVEEDVVRIFITPYKTSLSADDLEFSEGDFNVDVVVALGVKQQEDLDEAITAHGRILHDATVTSINTSDDGGLGDINWHDSQASSLSELVTDLIQALNTDLLDGQIATALLTGIVSETGRFSNDRTSSQTMSASALLLSVGANQQLVASKLDSGEENAPEVAADNSDTGEPSDKEDDGVLQIDHAEDESEEAPAEPGPEPQPGPEPPSEPAPEPPAESPEPPEPTSSLSPGAKLIIEPPKITAAFNANSETEHLEPGVDPMGMPTGEKPASLDHKPEEPPAPDVEPPQPPAGPPPEPTPPASEPPTESPAPPSNKNTENFTLSDLEKSVDSPHLKDRSLDSVRNEVDQALAGTNQDGPIKALNAQPLGDDLHPPQPPAGPPTPPQPATPPAPAGPGDSVAPSTPPKPEGDSQQDNDPNAPPPVPPPIPFQFGNPPSPPQ